MARHMGETIKAMAVTAGYKPEDVAHELRLTVGAVYGIYRNENVNTEKLFAFSALFKVPIAAFFGDDYEQVAQIEEPVAEFGQSKDKERQIWELKSENERLKLTIEHKDEMLSVYKSIQRN